MDNIQQRIAKLSAAKRQLLEARLAGASVPAALVGARAGAWGVDGTTRFRASMAQRRLWFIDKLVGDSPVYNLAHTIRFRGPLDRSRLRDCLGEILRRHDTLRMVFPVPEPGRESRLLAVVTAPAELHMPVVDLAGLSESERPAQVHQRAVELGARPYDLAAGPVVRLTLLCCAEDDHVLVFAVHHIALDRWSMGVLMTDLAALYSAGPDAVLPPLNWRFSDYAAWQHAQADEPAMGRHLDYWRALLADAPPPLDLPGDHRRPGRLSYRGQVEVRSLAPRLVDAVSRVGRDCAATPYMTFLAAFQVLLHRYTGRDDFVIGTPVAGRNRLETEPMIGPFLNILPVRTRIQGNPTLGEFLQQVKAATIELLAHQDLPFDRLVEKVHLDRDGGRHPLFDVVFNFHNVPYAPAWPRDLCVELQEVHLGASRFDLALTLRPAADGALTCEFEYRRDLFEPETIARMADHFEVLLAGFAAGPSQTIGTLPLLDEVQRRQLLQDWSCPSRPVLEADPCVHQLFERQVARTPHADALVFQHQRLSYQQFNERANRLAWHLRALGVGPDRLVAVCLRRTIQLPIAIFAVLKAGGAYVPLDPAYPSERLTYMLQDSAAGILLTESDLAGLLAPDPARTVVCIDKDASVIARRPAANPPSQGGPENLAYVIYTSGSTGRPKGAAIEHRGPAGLLAWARDTLPDDQISGFLLSTSVCFDFSVLELFVPLARGGKIILVQNLLELPACPAAGEVTFINAVPSVMTELLRIEGVPASVVAIGLGGEAVPAAQVLQCYDLPGVRAVYNVYGPTEDCVASTIALIPRQLRHAPAIGRPIGGSEVYILDAHMQPVPVGVVGELHVGGSKLARGYLNRPELTAERFVASPFSSAPRRIYRTGDLGHWNADGSVQCLGRTDHQVKLRGFRIELGEIEAVLASHPGVGPCAVVVRGDETDRRLAAYLVAKSSEPPRPAELRRHLAARLPEHMIPAAFVVLDAMPFTPSGKIDRRALPDPPYVRPAAADPSVEPQGPTQIHLARIWCDVLRLERVGAHDNFFQLGGDSLRLLTVGARMQQSMGVDVPLDRYFEFPTIAAMAGLIDSRSPTPGDARPHPVPFRQSVQDAGAAPGPDQPVPLSYGQERLWFIERLEPDVVAYNVALAQRLVGALDVRKLEEALTAVVRRHESLRTLFLEIDGAAAAFILPPERARTSIAPIDLTAMPPEARDVEVRRLLAVNSDRRFDLARGPLLRAVLLSVGPREHILSLCFHHIIFDEWSIRLLFAEMSRFYAGQGPAGGPADQYRHFVAWQRKLLESGQAERQKSHWRRQLAGADMLPALPTDHPRPRRQSYAGACEPVEIGPAATRALRSLSRRQGATSFMTLLAAFNVLLARWTGAASVVVGTPVTLRDPAETHDMIGYFLNTLALRTDLGGDPTFRQLLDRVRRTVIAAFANRDLPFDQLIQDLHIDRDPAHPPLVQVVLVVLNEPPAVLQLPGIAATDLPAASVIAKFDMTLFLNDSGDRIRGWFEYNTDLFDAATVRDVAARFVQAVEQVAADPDRSIGLPTPSRARPAPAGRAPRTPGESSPSNGAPLNDVERQLLAVWRDILGVPAISRNDNFFELGGHSLLAVRLIDQIKRRLGHNLPLVSVFESPTIAKLAAAIERQHATGASEPVGSRFVVPLQAPNGRPALFCIPGAGGHAFMFRQLARSLGPEQPVYGVQFQGLEMAPQAMESVEETATALLEHVRRTQPHGPYWLAGYCFGGVVAFEMARQLLAQGQRVDFLALFDGFAPGTRRKRPLHQRLRIHARRLFALGPRDSVTYSRDRLKNLATSLRFSSPAEPDDTSMPDDGPLLDAIRHVQAATLRAYLVYRPLPIPGAMTLFRATIRPDWTEFLIDRPFNGWETLVTGAVDVHDIPSSHLTMLQEPAVTILAAKLATCLDRAARGQG